MSFPLQNKMPFNLVGCLPLTPALTPEEREKRSQRFGEITPHLHRETENGSCSTIHALYKITQRLFPLPGGEGQGEGQGEGKRGAQSGRRAA